MIHTTILNARLRGLAFLIIASIAVVGCASESPRVSAEQLASHTGAQYLWLASLRHGMSVEEALEQAPPYKHYVFQYKDKGAFFHYMQGRYPVTETLYALFFEDGRLASLLLNQSVTEADSYHFHLYRRKDAWPLTGFENTVEWIKVRDRIGGDFNTLCRPGPSVESVSETPAADAIEAAAHVPIALVAAPIALPFLFFGSGDKEWSDEPLAQVELGLTTSAQLLELLGKPMGKREHEWGERWSYRVPDASFGLVGGIVMWGESNWWGTPIDRSTRAASCTSQ